VIYSNAVYSVLGATRIFRCPYCDELHEYDVSECARKKYLDSRRIKRLVLVTEALCGGGTMVGAKDSDERKEAV